MSVQRVYKWVRVDVACLHGMGVTVGVGFWPVPDVFRTGGEDVFVRHITRAIRDWIGCHGGDPEARECNHVACAEVELGEEVHGRMLGRWHECPPDSHRQIYPCPYSPPLPEGVLSGQR